MNIAENIKRLRGAVGADVTLVAVSKTRTSEEILEAYHAGQRVFGENKIQEMAAKYEALPKDIEWHMIGHVQTNKVKYMAPFVRLVHSVDSQRLLEEIDLQARKNDRSIDCLLQMHIATEETKYGLDEDELASLVEKVRQGIYPNIKVKGLMGMATFTDNKSVIVSEFAKLKSVFDLLATRGANNNMDMKILSMGMSADYKLAIANGSNMVRIGSDIFGAR